MRYILMGESENLQLYTQVQSVVCKGRNILVVVPHWSYVDTRPSGESPSVTNILAMKVLMLEDVCLASMLVGTPTELYKVMPVS